MSSVVCIDASFVIPALVPHIWSERAEALLGEWTRAGTTLIAPTLLAFEVTATIRRLVHANQINPNRGEQAISQFLRMPLHLSARRSLFPIAFRLATEFRQPTAYDAAYLALAEVRRCEFWTADERLYNSVKDQLAWVTWIGSFRPSESRI